MVKRKQVVEVIFWLVLNLPFIVLFLYLNYLSQTVWGVSTEPRLVQLTMPIGIIVLLMALFNKLLGKYIYEYVLIKEEGNKHIVSVQGRGLLKKIFIRRKRVYRYTGITTLHGVKYFYLKDRSHVINQHWK